MKPNPQNEPKYCINCKHHVEAGEYLAGVLLIRHKCGYYATIPSLVTGDTPDNAPLKYCKEERQTWSLGCGTVGIHFQPKDN